MPTLAQSSAYGLTSVGTAKWKKAATSARSLLESRYRSTRTNMTTSGKFTPVGSTVFRGSELDRRVPPDLDDRPGDVDKRPPYKRKVCSGCALRASLALAP